MFNIFKKKGNEEDIEGKEKDTDENKEGFLSKLKEGLEKTRKGMAEKIDSILKSYGKIDNGLFDELEEILVTSDVGINTTMDIIERLKTKVKENKVTEAIEVKELLKNEIKDILNEKEKDRELNIEPSPAIVLVVGVNGVGKTTTIGKLAYNLREEGKRVLIAAGDTFRAAAIEQLGEWSKRAGVGWGSAQTVPEST